MNWSVFTDKERLDWLDANGDNLLAHRYEVGTFGWLARCSDETPWPERGAESWLDLRTAIDVALSASQRRARGC
jgi:hypothetical protein